MRRAKRQKVPEGVIVTHVMNQSYLGKHGVGERKERAHLGTQSAFPWLEFMEEGRERKTQDLLDHGERPPSTQSGEGLQLRMQDAIQRLPGGLEPSTQTVECTPFLKPDILIEGESLGQGSTSRF